MNVGEYHIVVVDDESSNLESLERILVADGAKVSCFTDPRLVLSFIRDNPVDIILTDYRMGNMNGSELLAAVKFIDPAIEILVMTAYGTVELAVSAMKKGAFDFISKPLQRVQVLKAVHMALERRRLVNENLSLREALSMQAGGSGGEILGRSHRLVEMMGVAQQAARSRANVLIEGESGTGKGALAEYIHMHSEGPQGIFVKINCSAIPENLLEAELFGYEAGAFTGAAKRKKGRIELADGGTLFLDEIGIAPGSFQAKLLRFLQEGEFERLGSNETIRVKARVISATNTNLKRAMAAGTFREDLYYRLNVIHIRVPSLAERSEDIPLLAQRFLEDSAKKNGRNVPLIASEALDCLCKYRWPGNIRELQNLMERVVVLNREGVVRAEDLPEEIGQNQRCPSIIIPIGSSLREAEKRLLSETLKSTRGDKKLAAKLLGIHPRTIYRYLEEGEQEVCDFKPKEPPVKMDSI